MKVCYLNPRALEHLLCIPKAAIKAMIKVALDGKIRTLECLVKYD